MWANERERQREGEVVGEGVKMYDTQRGRGACESLVDAEGRAANKTGRGEKEWKEGSNRIAGLHACPLF